MSFKSKIEALLRTVWPVAFVVAALASGNLVHAQAPKLPLEIKQDRTAYNTHSIRGVPLSDTVGVPPGSNGDAPGAETGLLGTVGQYQSAVVFSGVAAPAQPGTGGNTVSNLDPNSNLAVNAPAIGLPVGRSSSSPNSEIIVVLKSARIGSPYVSRNVSFLFGQIIPPPDTDEYGVPLASTNDDTGRLPERPQDYWLAEPYTTTAHTNGYYWSIHARQVFAIQPGPIEIVWRRSSPSDAPQDFPQNAGMVTSGTSSYIIYTNHYVVSGSPAKAPKKIYWTERTFRNTGKPVAVPSARVGAVNVVYNNNFPQRVASEYLAPGQLPIVEEGRLEETRTLWHDTDTGQILAYNREGRVFLELLGDNREDGQARFHLGYEIVDVIRQPNPSDVTVDLGERLRAWQDGRDDSALFPEPLLQSSPVQYAYRHSLGNAERPDYYATRETLNLNDYLIHWMEAGEVGLRWPFLLVRYKLIWPVDAAEYSHYVRPLVLTEDDAKATAVALPTDNAPTIEYQDPLDFPRAKLTETFKFYTYLEPSQPFHRTLIRFNAGDQIAFERVFSWLDARLKSGQSNDFANTLVTGLKNWDPTNGVLTFDDVLTGPRVVTQNVDVGARIMPPVGELGTNADDDYWAGHIREEIGTDYSVTAYINPFLLGFEEARASSIIPVNARPDKNRLEVWWFRKNSPNLSRGFRTIYWPSIIGRYTITWPVNAKQIVLASNDGSGGLMSLEAKGAIYYQNIKELPGYNPNEEHALMLGGQAYALRDDLNVLSADDDYTSAPFVLLQHVGSDGRPAMRVFEVVRERPDLGITFDYAVNAGTVLQAPMPLPLMDKPLVKRTFGEPPVSLNREVGFWRVATSAADTNGASLTTDGSHYFRSHKTLSLQDDTQSPPTTYYLHTTNAPFGGTLVEGFVSRYRPFELSIFPGYTEPTNKVLFTLVETNGLGLGTNVVIFPLGGDTNWPASIVAMTNHDVELEFAEDVDPTLITDVDTLINPVDEQAADSFSNWRLATESLPPVPVDERSLFYASFTFQDRKGNVWVYRGPHDEAEAPSMQMQFYYRTLPGFYFPSLDLGDQPPIGTITPYLRVSPTPGTYLGDAVYGDVNNDGIGDENSLAISYNPVWPANAPVLHMAESLTLPKRGLPAVRGQTSLQILYQQSQAAAEDEPSVVLHDPTREKQFSLAAPDSTTPLGAIPDSIARTVYIGKTYFPNLPPHLVERFFYDPNRGENGALVFKGQFVDEALGDDYLLLNVLGVKDKQALKDLCLADDSRKTAWDQAIDGLSTAMELFVENQARPGTYIPSGGDTVTVGPDALAEVWNDDVAVDSYALTATGPSHGYVTLVAGNGLAFTPVGDPVSLHIVKVVDKLYPGEVKVIAAANPLSEKITMQQVVDLAGKADEYRFEWMIAAPVDGLPPAVYQSQRRLLLGDVAWNHVRYPLGMDSPASIHLTPAGRRSADVTDRVAIVQRLTTASVTVNDNQLEAFVAPGTANHFTAGNQVVLVDGNGREEIANVSGASTETRLVATVNVPSAVGFNYGDVREIREHLLANGPQSIVYRDFEVENKIYSEVWLSLELDNFVGARVYIDGGLVAVVNMPSGNTPFNSPPATLSPLSKVFRLSPAVLGGGSPNGESTTHVLSVELFGGGVANSQAVFKARIEAFEGVDQVLADGSQWIPIAEEKYADGVRAILGEGADVRALADNYVIMRYRPASQPDGWSQWTVPQLAEGWIKRVLAGINPFNQRVNDLFNNRVNTDVSIIAQAGGRWEGDVALNLANINNFGLIEIYETVLRRGKMLSIASGINYGPANDALLLAAGYLNDLYMMLGNEAWADAMNPTIGIGTKDRTYGDIATALFAFKGQVASLLDEELALLRGRDDFLQPGVEVSPVYNRLIWNYTRGIDSGEVIYALNYNIMEDTDEGVNGVVNADDARKMYPQGHGDAYGHYLTALKGYYQLMLDTDFDWVPRTEAVLVLGKPVQVDYLDERKFAAAASAVTRAGRQIFDLTWKKEYLPGKGNGWKHFSETRTNDRRTPTVTRYWGADHWASRVGQGTYLNWVIGNAILPEVDEDPSHEGIQKIDRTTVPELNELSAAGFDLQTALDNAEGGLTPLGLPEDSLVFDINPNQVVGTDPKPHFEQVYERARVALQNALLAFDDAKDVTRLMRSEEDSLAEFRAKVAEQELAYTHKLIELYGTPYPDDVGPGKTYATGYTGPDLLHYMYVDIAELTLPTWHDPTAVLEAKFDMQLFHSDYMNRLHTDWDHIVPQNGAYREGEHYVSFIIQPHGFFDKPSNWTGRRPSPGRIQQAISEVIVARNKAAGAYIDADWQKWVVDKAIQMFKFRKTNHDDIRSIERDKLIAQQTLKSAEFVSDVLEKSIEISRKITDHTAEALKEALPEVFIVGLASGGDITSAADAALEAAKGSAIGVLDAVDYVRFFAIKGLAFSTETAERWLDFEQIAPKQWDEEIKKEVIEIGNQLSTLQGLIYPMNTALQNLDDARRKYRSLTAEGDRLQEEREIFRRRAAAVIQGYRTRDAAFRIFRNEKLERYKTLFDLAAQYAFLAANAYDYETGLLHTQDGKAFVQRILASRALGVVRNGEPQFAGSDTGDPGLSSALAEMKADWMVLKGRLGFNNPDAYGTTVSLRAENHRILPGTEGHQNWTDLLHKARRANLLDDEDVRRYCMQIGGGNGLAVPGLILEFSTTIADGHNLFGKPLAAGDHNYSVSSFATKIYGVGVALEGYVGMDNPSANSGAVGFAGGNSPGDPGLSFLDPQGLAATPYVYLVPAGVDSMRSPPLGDQSVVRTWSVRDITLPLPFNIGGSEFSGKQLYQSSDSLTEELFGLRKHQAFRPVSSASLFTPNIFSSSGALAPSQFTNRRLIGRSVWNSKWKLVIPGHTLLNDPNEGLDRFIQTVKDVKLHFVTYSYAGN